MAAIHISVRASHLAGPSIFEPTFEHQVIPNEASANSLKDAREDYEKDAPVRGVDERGQIAPDYPVTFIGIRAVSYDDASAKIALLVGGLDHAETGQYLGMILDLRWIDGDWNLFLAEKEVEPLRATRKDLDLVALLPERS